LLKQSHLTKEISRVEIGDDYFLAIIAFQYYRYRTLDDVIEGIALITFVDDRLLGLDIVSDGNGTGSYPNPRCAAL